MGIQICSTKTLDGKRHWISKCGYDTKQEAYDAAIQKIREVYAYQLEGGHENLVDKM